MKPLSQDSQASADLKVELVLRMLAGESIAAVSRQTAIPRQQLSTWRRRFIAGGEHYLESRTTSAEIEALRSSQDDLSREVVELAAENRLLTRRVALLKAQSGPRFSHPYCSEAYAQALRESNASSFAVPAWGTHVLVREGPGGKRLAVGARPFASLNPGCDLRAGLDHLQEAGITSISLVTDPLWGADAPELQQAFDVCRRFKEIYLVDKSLDRVKIGKRHRNRINKARGGAEVREVSLAEHLDSWFELYRRNVANRKIPQPFTNAHFEYMATLPELRTVAVLVDEEIATITMWLPYRDTLYFHDAASSETGHAVAASYLAFAHVVEHFDDCRYIFLGGSAEFFDDPLDGLARFKRGFANSSDTSFMCSSILSARSPR